MDAARRRSPSPRSMILEGILARWLAAAMALGAGRSARAGAPGTTAVASDPAAASLSIANASPGRFMLTNRSPRVLRLATAAGIERRAADGSWHPLETLDAGRGYRLVKSCDVKPVEECVELPPNATLQPVPWSGLHCAAQCNLSCRAEAWEGPGVFRLSVASCEGGAPFRGPAFELAALDEPTKPAGSRWGLSGEVVAGRVARLAQPDGHWEPDAAAASDKIAGLTIRRGSERALSGEALSALVGLLRAPDGFNDTVMKRCALGPLVGFRLVQQLSAGGGAGEAGIEVAIDFVCNKIFVVRGEGSGRKAEFSHFDPARARFLALVRRIFPGDVELARLR